MNKAIFLVIFLIILQSSAYGAYWNTYAGSPEYDNYIEATGNISYPEVSLRASIRGISRTILATDINHDGKVEIIGTSLLNNSLYMFNNTLHVLWSFKENEDQILNKEKISFSKISAVAVGNITGDSHPEVIFSMCDGKSNETTLHVFNYEGKEIWKKEVEGRITQQSIFVADVDSDGTNEVVCGGKRINIFYGNGTLKYDYEPRINTHEGISEILFSNHFLFAGIWDSSDNLTGQSSNFYRGGRGFTLLKMSIDSDGIKQIWKKRLEKDGCNIYVFQSNGRDKLFVRNDTKSASIDSIDMKSGNIIWSYHTKYADIEYLPFSIDNNSKVFWSISRAVMALDPEGNLLWQRNASGVYTPSQYTGTIGTYDVDNDGNDEVIVLKYNGEMECLNSKDGNPKWKINIYESPKENMDYFDYTPSIIHADTDNDGFDEIITVDPEGRIVIIDNGTPPSENQNSMFSQELIIGRTVIFISSIAIAVIWLWRKRKE